MVKSYFKGIKNILLENINRAEKEIVVAVAWFTNHELFNSLCEKLKEGKIVSICIINDEINNREDGLNFQYFITLGGNLFFAKNDELMHHKFCIIDNKILFNGSYNWTYFAENRNRENLILFSQLPEVISDFKKEFVSTISNSDYIYDLSSYIKNNKPQYSQELSRYLSYDILYQAKHNMSNNSYKRSQELLLKALKHNNENKEAKLEQTKLDVILKTSTISENESSEIAKAQFDIPSLLRNHELEIFTNYISESPNRQKAFASALAIYDYEKEVNFKNINSYNSVNPGYIMMVFGEYNKAKEFLSRNNSALGYYDHAVLHLLLNDFKNFSLYINKAMLTLGNEDQTCVALYIPRISNNMTEYVEKKQTKIHSTETISLKSTIMQIKQDFKV